MSLKTVRNLDTFTRDCAWTAIDDDTYAGDPSDPIGRGATEADAVADLMEQMEERT